MSSIGFDHVGILVEDFTDARTLAHALGIALDEPEPEPELGIEILWARVDGVAIEFIRPIRRDSRAANALRAGQAGVHHVALAVDDLDATLARLAAAGCQRRDGDPRPGAHGTRIAFLDEASVGGSRVELVERPTTVTTEGQRSH